MKLENKDKITNSKCYHNIAGQRTSSVKLNIEF